VLIGEPIGIPDQSVEPYFPDFFVTDVDSAVEVGKFHIDPPGILSRFTEISRVFHHLSIYRIFEGVRITRYIKTLISPLGKLDCKITGRFRGVGTVTGDK
jgi:hypothetical protein